MIHDLTEGKPAKQLWLFSMPMLLSVVFQQMYNIVDSVVAGQCVGEDALAAVGSSYPITMIFMAIATGMNIGCSVIISQYFGAKKAARNENGDQHVADCRARDQRDFDHRRAGVLPSAAGFIEYAGKHLCRFQAVFTGLSLRACVFVFV